MTENTKNPTAQNKTVSRHKAPSEAYGSGSASGFLSENAKTPNDGSDWLGGPQNGNEITSEAMYGSNWPAGGDKGIETPGGNAGNGGNGGNAGNGGNGGNG